MHPRFSSLCEVYEYGNRRLRFQQHQEEGGWKHPQDRRGMCILSVSKGDPSHGNLANSVLIFEPPLRDPHQNEKEGKRVAFSPFRVMYPLKPRITCRSVMPGGHAQRVSGLGAR